MTVEIELLESRDSWQNIVTTLDSYGFEVSGQEEVQFYLSNHPDMLDPTFQICFGLRQEFGPAASLTLEVYRDPEFDASHLIIYVRFPHYPSDLMGRIDSVVDKCIGLIDTSGRSSSPPTSARFGETSWRSIGGNALLWPNIYRPLRRPA